MHPAVAEGLTLGIIGVSGVSLGLLFGLRQVVPLTILALAGATVIRTWAAFTMWSLGRNEWALEAWWVAGALTTTLAILLRWSHWKQGLSAVLLFGVGSLIALSSKYLLDIGERHHSDSGNTVALAVVAIQGEMTDIEPLSAGFKRGIAYPLMLALGPEGRILGAFTPLVYLTLITAVAWLAWKIVGHLVSWKSFALILSAVAAFSMTVPIFRAAMFYLNAHTLMALSMVLLLTGFFLSRQENRLSAHTSAFYVVGGILGVTARIEGIALVLIVFLALVGQKWWSDSSDRLRLFSVLGLIGMSLTWWLSSLDSPVLQRFGISDWLLVVFSLLGAAIAASSWVDRIRGWFLPAAIAFILIALAQEVWESTSPLDTVLAQWPNLGLGQGGWGTAAHLFIGSVVILGWRHRSREYQWLLGFSVLTIATILITKTLDGGFGREGFYDSVNRMWLHAMPIIAVTTLTGYTELVAPGLRSFQPARKRLLGGRHGGTNQQPKLLSRNEVEDVAR